MFYYFFVFRVRWTVYRLCWNNDFDICSSRYQLHPLFSTYCTFLKFIRSSFIIAFSLLETKSAFSYARTWLQNSRYLECGSSNYRARQINISLFHYLSPKTVVDEAFISISRGKISHWQYVPANSIEWGTKYWISVIKTVHVFFKVKFKVRYMVHFISARLSIICLTFFLFNVRKAKNCKMMNIMFLAQKDR